MFVAEQLGMSLTEVGKMSVVELIQWIAYFEVNMSNVTAIVDEVSKKEIKNNGSNTKNEH